MEFCQDLYQFCVICCCSYRYVVLYCNIRPVFNKDTQLYTHEYTYTHIHTHNTLIPSSTYINILFWNVGGSIRNFQFQKLFERTKYKIKRIEKASWTLLLPTHGYKYIPMLIDIVNTHLKFQLCHWKSLAILIIFEEKEKFQWLPFLV